MIILPERLPNNAVLPWNKAGVEGGIPPRNTIYTVLLPNGSDDTSTIQNAINSCPANQVVKLGPGTYYLSAYINLKPHVILRGSGVDTIIIAPLNQSAFNFAADSGGIAKIALATDVSRGSNTLTLVNVSGTIPVYYDSLLTPGNIITVSQWMDNSTFICTGICEGVHNSEETYPGSGVYHNRVIGQVVRLVSRNGRDITVTPNLYYSYQTSLNAQISWSYNGANAENCIEWAGIEDLKVNCQNTTSPTLEQHAITGSNAGNCWVQGVEINNSYTGAIHFSNSCHITMHRNYIHNGADPDGGGGQGYGYMLEAFVSDSLIENNIAYLMETPIILGWGTQGNVVAYNYIPLSTYGGTVQENIDLSIHAAGSIFNIFEGNIAHKLEFDNFHGSGLWNTVWRNWLKGHQPWSTAINWAVAIDEQAHYINIIGNILGDSLWTNPAPIFDAVGPKSYSGANYIRTIGFSSSGGGFVSDTQVAATLAWHGNYDIVLNGQRWEISNTNVTDYTNHTIEDSLYLSSKPIWFGNCAWPPVNPDQGLPANEQILPAGIRWLAGTPIAKDAINEILESPGLIFYKTQVAIARRR